MENEFLRELEINALQWDKAMKIFTKCSPDMEKEVLEELNKINDIRNEILKKMGGENAISE